MEQKHRFAIVAAILTLLCLIIQIHAVRLLMTPSQENPPSKSAEPSEENTVQSVATEQDEVGKKGVDDTAHRSRKLEKLDALEDFMAFSASELQMGEAIRENNLPHDSWLMIDTTKANWREKKDKLLADRRKWLADAMDMLEKYRIGFIYDVGAYLETLEKVKTMEAAVFVPSHAAATEDIAELAEYNIRTVREIADRITALCAEPLCFEEILQKLFAEYALTMNFEQCVLVGSTVRSYLAWLKDIGVLSVAFTDNRLLWKQAT